MGWVSTPRHARLTSGKESVPIVQEARWVPGPVWYDYSSIGTTIVSLGLSTFF